MEAKLEPGREIDALVAERMGKVILWADQITGSTEDAPLVEDEGSWMFHPKGGTVATTTACPYYSTDIAAAFPIAIKHQLILIPLQGGSWFCGQKDLNGSWYFDPVGGHLNANFKHFAEGTTPAHSICLAFLELKKE